MMIVVAAVLALTAAGCDWPMYRFGPDHTGWNRSEHTLNVGNVSTLVTRFTAAAGSEVFLSSPAVAHGVVYIGSESDGKLYAFDAAGTTNCSGMPVTCAPLWTAEVGGRVLSSPAVVRGVVYIGSEDDHLYAFDAAGRTNCSGTPKTCAPLWTAATGGFVDSSPTVARGVVYVGSGDGRLYAFDAAGRTNCSGTPKTCAPLWTAAVGNAIVTSPAVAKGLVYIGSEDGHFAAFDAAGSTRCSGTPKTCVPRWTAVTPTGVGQVSSPAVANGIVFVGADTDGKLYAFDAAGTNPLCSGTPAACEPLWTGPTGEAIESSPAVANGVVYVGSHDDHLYAFDATGVTNCSGTPKTCASLWTGGRAGGETSPAVANGVVYVGSHNFHTLSAFDAAGNTDCSGSPKVCDRLFSAFTGNTIDSSPAVANGMVYIGSGDGNLYAFGLPN